MRATDILHRCKEILALIEASEAEAGEARTSPAGLLRIRAPLSFGQIYVVPALTRYLEKHPLVRAEVTLSQRSPDLLDEGFDVSSGRHYPFARLRTRVGQNLHNADRALRVT